MSLWSLSSALYTLSASNLVLKFLQSCWSCSGCRLPVTSSNRYPNTQCVLLLLPAVRKHELMRCSNWKWYFLNPGASVVRACNAIFQGIRIPRISPICSLNSYRPWTTVTTFWSFRLMFYTYQHCYRGNLERMPTVPGTSIWWFMVYMLQGHSCLSMVTSPSSRCAYSVYLCHMGQYNIWKTTLRSLITFRHFALSRKLWSTTEAVYACTQVSCGLTRSERPG